MAAKQKAAQELAHEWLSDPNVIDMTHQEPLATNITKYYTVTGYAEQGNVDKGVLIKGRILTVGDRLDGMVIVAMVDKTIF